MESTIISLLQSTRREGMDDLIRWLRSTDYFYAPASVKYHSNYRQGLAIHSHSVYKVLKMLNENLCLGLPEDSVIICGLLHDVCKIGIYKLSPELEFIRRDELPLGHSEKSIIILQKFIELTDKEMILIRWHMGKYDPALQINSRALSETHPYYKLLYFADDISSSLLEVKR